jgi:POT family proton-dependent oligopeptide transporter
MSTSTAAQPEVPQAFRGHPKGLYLLFTTEMWERMSYYGMRALLALYIADKVTGLGADDKLALQVYGIYTGLVWFTPLAGGFLADRYLGQRRAVLIGGTLMMVGHFLMAVPALVAFVSALVFLILGVGLLKPNISAMVGKLYPKGDPRRDGAFTIFYMGINVGALLGPLISGTLGEKMGWHYGFAAAGVGMALGLIGFVSLQKKLLGSVGLAPSKEAKRERTDQPLSRDEIDRIAVIAILAFFSIFFWAAFEQAGGLMNLYTKAKVDRVVGAWEIPASTLQAVQPMFILLCAPLFSVLWTALGKRRKDPSPPVKMALGLLLVSVGFVFMCGAARQSSSLGKAALMWIVGAYLFHSLGELCLSPVGLSMVTKVAPARFVSLMMGVFFLSNAAANYLAGFVGGFARDVGELQLFAAIVAVTFAAGLILLALSRALHRMMHGTADVRSAEPRADGALEPAGKPKLASG